jgi:branched-chain amino acid transport system ATP-binding protein
MSGQTMPLVSVQDLQVRYRNGALGVRGVTLEVNPGEIVAVLGPNGAGKTTVVRSITGFLKSEGARCVAGGVTIMSRATTGWEPHRVSRLGVSFIPERRKVFRNLSVAENLEAVRRLPSSSRRRAIDDRIFDLFPELAARRSVLAGRLSGGQQQMVAIARGLMNEPRLLVIDELTLGLHHSLRRPLFEALRRVTEDGVTLVVVDESAGFALDYADRCYIMNSGRVQQVGTPEDFRGNELLAAGYVGAHGEAFG